MKNSSREAAELVRCMSVDRSRKGRIKANSVQSQFDNITHKIGRPRPEPEYSDDEVEDQHVIDHNRRSYQSNLWHKSTHQNRQVPAGEETAISYPKSWLREPGAKKSNLYASKLSNLLYDQKDSSMKNASKSTVQLMQTLSIYGQINVPVCELTRIFQSR